MTEIDQNYSDTNSDSAGIADIVASAAVEGLYHWKNGLRQGRRALQSQLQSPAEKDLPAKAEMEVGV